VESGLSEGRLADASPVLPSPSPTPEVQPEPSPTLSTPSPTPSPSLEGPSSPRPSALVAQVPPPTPPAAQRSMAPAPATPVRRASAPAPAPTTARPAASRVPVQADLEDAPAPQIVAMESSAGSQTAHRAPGTATNHASERLDSAPPTPALEVQARAPEPSIVRSGGADKSLGGAFDPAPTADRAAAVESQARQIVGEGSVSVEGGGEGPVHVIVRTHRSLTSQEKEDLRRRLRRDLGLRDSDTITIR